MKLPLVELIFCLPAFTIQHYNVEKDQYAVVEMAATNDDHHSFMPLAKSYEAKKQLMQSLTTKSDGLYIIEGQQEILAFLRSVKMKSPSQELVEEFKAKGTDYHNMVTMLLSQPNLPKASKDFVLRVSLIVAKSYRKLGFGKMLMEFAESEAKKDSEISAITLDVQADNVAAIKLYESLGYKCVVYNKKIGLISYKKDILFPKV